MGLQGRFCGIRLASQGARVALVASGPGQQPHSDHLPNHQTSMHISFSARVASQLLDGLLALYRQMQTFRGVLVLVPDNGLDALLIVERLSIAPDLVLLRGAYITVSNCCMVDVGQDGVGAKNTGVRITNRMTRRRRCCRCLLL